jgi:serine/threonine protein kinase
VADFGISTVKPAITRTMTVIGTPIYMAPEVLSKNKYSEKADVYSFGIVLAEIFTGVRPYSDGEAGQMNQAQLMFNIVNNALRPSLEGIPSPLQQLILECWNIVPNIRPTFEEIALRLKRLSNLPELQLPLTLSINSEEQFFLTGGYDSSILDDSDGMDSSERSSLIENNKI